MGDPTGAKRYSTLSSEPEQKWRTTLANPLRRAWCRRYLSFLGPERLATMGYDLDRLLGELDALPPSRDSLATDLRRFVVDVAKEPIRVRARTQQTGAPNVIRELLRARPDRAAARARPAGRKPHEDRRHPHEDRDEAQKNQLRSTVVQRTASPVEKPTRT